MSEPSKEQATAYTLAAKRLHHLSMRYSGAIVELAKGEPVGMLPQNLPGLRQARDLIDLILLTRAEINGLSRLLIEAKIITNEQATVVFTDEYEWLAKNKAQWLGVGLTDEGIVISNSPERQ